MKHLIAREHHHHFKRRLIVEMVGLILLVIATVSQRRLFVDVGKELTRSHWGYVVLSCAIYWLILPLTPLSYRVLSHRPISIMQAALAQMAAAGPGRIIPGGLGHIAIGTAHLHHSKIPKQRALLVPILNNLVGFFVTIIACIVAILFGPTVTQTSVDALSVSDLTRIIIGLLLFVAFGALVLHAHFFRKYLRSIRAQMRAVSGHLFRHPVRLLIVMMIACLILCAHILILITVARAVDVHLSGTVALYVLSAGTLLGSFFPTPGGIGGVEAGVVSSLILFGIPVELATSTALLFRLTTYWQPLVPGIFAYIYLRNRQIV